MSDAALRHGEGAIAQGSKSFGAAARLFDARTRRSVVLLYAWCRACDDAVDGQTLGRGAGQGHDTAAALARLEAETRAALMGRACADPVYAGLAEVVQRHAIPQAWLLDHLAGYAMDVEGRRYQTLPDLMAYCYAVAGAVGLMMARIMGVEDEDTLDRACDLGLAFQLTNIARDVVEDAALGRVYLPLEWLAQATIPERALAEPAFRPALAEVAARLVGEAEPYYASALTGVGRLPLRSAAAIAAARGVYRSIGMKVAAAGPAAWDARIFTRRREKLAQLARALPLALAARRLRHLPRPPGLWQRPRRAAP